MFTTADKKQPGEIDFIDFIRPLSMNSDVISSFKVVIDERFDKEPISFYILELLANLGKLTNTARKTNYTDVALENQQITMYDLRSTLNTINLVTILDENA